MYRSTMKRILLLISAVLALVSCKEEQETAVPFKQATNYFFRNDAEIPSDVKITDKATFESLFGMAAVMGENGMPTAIDWDKEFVIAIVKPKTQADMTMEPLSLIAKGKTLVYKYCVTEEPGNLSYTIRPVLLIIVDKQWENLPVKLEEETNNLSEDDE